MDDETRAQGHFGSDSEAIISAGYGDHEIKFEYKKKVKSCLVCGDNAFYYFYGAITCDSCRTFFRRQILQFKVRRRSLSLSLFLSHSLNGYRSTVKESDAHLIRLS
jgi:hypothetical protein